MHGRSATTVPCAVVRSPSAFTYLKYNPDSFAGRVVITPNGSIVADQYWFGNASQTYDEIRTDSRFNVDMSIKRQFPIAKYQLEIGADIMNVLNHTQFSGSYAGGLGGTAATPHATP